MTEVIRITRGPEVDLYDVSIFDKVLATYIMSNVDVGTIGVYSLLRCYANKNLNESRAILEAVMGAEKVKVVQSDFGPEDKRFEVVLRKSSGIFRSEFDTKYRFSLMNHRDEEVEIVADVGFSGLQKMFDANVRHKQMRFEDAFMILLKFGTVAVPQEGAYSAFISEISAEED